MTRRPPRRSLMERSRVASVRVEHTDGHPRLVRAAAIVAGAAAALRVVGLPPVDLHGPFHYLGIMDPLCGGTRGMLALARGDLAAAWRYNPIVPALAAATTVVLARALLGIASGRWINVRVLRRRALIGVALVVGMALWIDQQAHADLLADRPADRSVPSPWRGGP